MKLLPSRRKDLLWGTVLVVLCCGLFPLCGKLLRERHGEWTIPDRIFLGMLVAGAIGGLWTILVKREFILADEDVDVRWSLFGSRLFGSSLPYTEISTLEIASNGHLQILKKDKTMVSLDNLPRAEAEAAILEMRRRMPRRRRDAKLPEIGAEG